MHPHHRKMFIAGCVTGIAGLILLAALTLHAFGGDSEPPLTARFVLLAVVDLLLGATSLRLLGDACAGARIEQRTSGHVEGVHSTVDRLAAVLRETSR